MSDAQAAELMFRPVTELAALVRDGQLSARELVEASLGRIEELDPQVNAFVDVDAEGALAAADAIAPGDPRPFAGVPIAIKNNRAVEGRRLTFATPMLADHVAAEDHNVTRRLRQAGFVDRRHDDAARARDRAGRVSRACSVPRATRGTPAALRAAPRAARRRPWRRAWCRSPTPTTAAARRASRRPAAASSGSRPSAGGCRWPPTRVIPSWSATAF